MYRIIYVSAADKPFDAKALVELLREARDKNEKLDITGMLLYKDENFIQVLEGPDQAVKDLFAAISHDNRHRAIIALTEEPIRTREFGDWSMGFSNMAGVDEEKVPGLNKFLHEPLDPETLAKNPSRAKVLLETFAEIMR